MTPPALRARLGRGLRLYGVLQWAAIRSSMQYRLNFAISIVLGAVYQGSGFAFVWVVLERFSAVGGWTFGQVAFLYGLRLVAHGLWGVPFGSLIGLDMRVREGEFDRVLLRPLNPLVQVMTGELRVGPVGDLCMGIAIVAVAAGQAGISWSPVTVAFCLAAVVGGAMVEGAVLLSVWSLSFRLLEAMPLAFLADDIFSRFGSYPLHVFGAGVQWALTFVLPVAFMAYLPASAVLGVADHAPAWLGWIAPLVGIALFTAAYRFWRRQIRNYQSSGH